MASEQGEDRDDTDEIKLPDGQLTIESIADAAGNTATIYTRAPDPTAVSQSIDELLTTIEDDHGYEYNTNDRDALVNHPHRGGNQQAFGLHAEGGYDGVAVIYDIDESHPKGVERLIEFISDRDVDDVVTPSLAAFGGVEAGARTVERLQDENLTVHLVDDGLTILPDDDRARRWTAATRRAARNDDEGDGNELVTEAIIGDGWTGRPPLGFTVGAAGQLRRNDRWEEIRSTVKTHDDDLITEYRCAKLLGCSRDAIRNATTKYRDLYRLDAPDIDSSVDADTAEQ
jgi:hypothetical protein